MDSALVDRTSIEFLDQWKRLVSTTNWEKGKIIRDWRDALEASGAPASEYSDEAWSRRVGNVTPQHVGRLRRASERFGATREGYQGLYWSHFQAALDWDDAEMWLEGAVQNDWSISEMRHQRWEAQGGASAEEPSGDAASDSVPWDDDADSDDASHEVTSGTIAAVHTPQRSSSEDDDEDNGEEGYDHGQFDDGSEREHAEADTVERNEGVRPFENLPPLPADVNDAFEAYKLCILRHKLSGWSEISCEDMISSLEALKMLALAPAEV